MRRDAARRAGRAVGPDAARAYDRGEIPGWEGGGKGARLAGSVAKWILRRNGLTTERTTVGLGRRIVSEPGADGWRLTCALFWVDETEVEYDREEETDVERTRRRTEGMECLAAPLADTGAARWRFRAGIAPSHDSVAARYDALVAAGSADVTDAPTLSLDRLADGDGAAGYVVERDLAADGWSWTDLSPLGGALRLARAAGPPIAMLRAGVRAGVDLSPEATAEEARLARLLAAALAEPLRATRR